MTTDQLQTRVGTGLILAQFSIILLVVCLWFAGGFLYEEMKTTLGLITPMFAIYTTAIVTLFVQPPPAAPAPAAPSPPVEFRRAFVTIFFPVLFVINLTAMIVCKAYYIGFNSFDQFKDALGGVETAFGVYLATVLRALFDIK